MKKILNGAIGMLIISTGLSAFADPKPVNANEDKLVMLLAQPELLNSVTLPDSAINKIVKTEERAGDESTSVVYTIQIGAEQKTFVLTRDGGGTVKSVQLYETP